MPDEHTNHTQPPENPSTGYQDLPASPLDTYSAQPDTVDANPVFKILRIVIWLLPSIIVPVLMFCISTACLALHLEYLIGLLIFLSSIAATMAIGYLDQRIAAHQQQIEFARIKNEALGRVGIFTIWQIFIIPFVCFTLIIVLFMFARL